MEQILFFTFLAIFVLTAIIALLSLPGWIKIHDKYRKKLFTCLILEVIACIVFLFSDLLLNNNVKKKVEKLQTEYFLMEKNTGRLYRVSVTPKKEGIHEEEQEIIKKNEYSLEMDGVKKESFKITLNNDNKKQEIHGKILLSEIERSGLFNSLNIVNNGDIAIIDFYPYAPQREKKKIDILKKFPFKLEVNADATGVYYRCFKKDNQGNEIDIIENSVAGNEDRQPKIYQDNDTFYFIHIIRADFSLEKDEEKFVRFIIVKFKAEAEINPGI